MELLFPTLFSCHHLSISLVLSEIWQLYRRHINCITLTLLNGTFSMCLWDSGAWTSAVQMFWDNRILSGGYLWRSSLSFKARNSVACKHSHDIQTHIRCELSQCLYVLLKRYLRAQEAAFFNVWGYWNLLFVFETEKCHITSLLRTSYQQTGLWNEPLWWLLSFCIISRQGLSHFCGDDYLGMALCFTVPTPLT